MLRGFRFERLCLHRLALIIGGKLKHLRLRCLVPECQSLMATFFRPRTVSFAGGDKRAVDPSSGQFASPDPLIAPQALGRPEDMPRAAREAGSRDHGPRNVTQAVQQDGRVTISFQSGRR